MQRILIFGNGLVGEHIKNYFRNNLAISIYLSKTDPTDRLAVRVTLKETQPDLVINSNIVGPDALIGECMQRNLVLIHLSDDDVMTDYSIQSDKIESVELRTAFVECIRQSIPLVQNEQTP